MLRLLVTLPAVALFVPVVFTMSYAYSVPEIDDAKLVFEEKQLIADRDPPTEILIRTYKKPDGKLFRVYGVAGRVFRYDIDENGAAPYEYRLLDNDGDGVFETRERLVGEMVIRDKGLEYYIDLGPEPGKEYRYRYEREAGEPNLRQEAHILEGRSIFIPAWVLVEF